MGTALREEKHSEYLNLSRRAEVFSLCELSIIGNNGRIYRQNRPPAAFARVGPLQRASCSRWASSAMHCDRESSRRDEAPSNPLPKNSSPIACQAENAVFPRGERARGRVLHLAVAVTSLQIRRRDCRNYNAVAAAAGMIASITRAIPRIECGAASSADA